MSQGLAFREDSPAFREELVSCEANAHNVRAWLKKTVESVHTYTRARGAYSEAEKGFANELLAFGGPNQAVMSAGVGPALWTISAAFREVSDLSYSATLSYEKEFSNRIDIRIDEDAKALKEHKTRFLRADEKYRAALDRARAVKTSAAEDKLLGADRELVAARLLLESARFDLVTKLNEQEGGRQLDLLETMLECVRTQMRFFDSARAELGALCANLPAWAAFAAGKRAEMAALAESNAAAQRQLRKMGGAAHAHASPEPPLRLSERAPAHKEGYLFKKAKAHGTGWKRVWVTVSDGSLHYSSSSHQRPDAKRAAESRTQRVNLLLCTVQLRESAESGRRFCFEVVNPERRLVLQAESEKERQLWVDVMRNAIEQAFHALDTERGVASNSAKLDGTTAVESAPLLELRKAEGANLACADCGEARPDWAAINWGVLVCIECSGIHRSLGSHVSKVRSLTLDTWDTSLLELMRALGNRTVNGVLEASATGRKPTPTCSRYLKEGWIGAKYGERAFVAPPWAYGALAELLCAAVREDDCPTALCCLAQGAPIEKPVRLVPAPGLPPGLPPAPRAAALGEAARADGGLLLVDTAPLTPLQHAASSNSLRCLDLLCHWGAQSGCTQPHGLTALHCAAAAGHADACSALLKRGAPADAVDADGRSALDVALARGHEHIVALLKAPAEAASAAAAAADESPPPAATAGRTAFGSDGLQAQSSFGALQLPPAGGPLEPPPSQKHSRAPSLGGRLHGLFRRGSSMGEADVAQSQPTSPGAQAGASGAAGSSAVTGEAGPVDPRLSASSGRGAAAACAPHQQRASHLSIPSAGGGEPERSGRAAGRSSLGGVPGDVELSVADDVRPLPGSRARSRSVIVGAYHRKR